MDARGMIRDYEPSLPRGGRAALEEYFKERFPVTGFRFAFTFSDIQLAGDLAFERLAYSAVVWPAGEAQPVEDAGKGAARLRTPAGRIVEACAGYLE